MTTELLQEGERFVRICPHTKKPVVAMYEGNNEVLCLHNPTVEQDLEEVLIFLNLKKLD